MAVNGKSFTTKNTKTTKKGAKPFVTLLSFVVPIFLAQRLMIWAPAFAGVSGCRTIAMFKLVAFLTKKDGLAMGAFIEHYEQRHVPLILSLAPAPLRYERRYLERERPLGGKAEPVDFDAMTELWFADKDAYRAWMRAIGDPRVAEDEARFLDRAKTRAYETEAFETAL